MKGFYWFNNFFYFLWKMRKFQNLKSFKILTVKNLQTKMNKFSCHTLELESILKNLMACKGFWHEVREAHPKTLTSPKNQKHGHQIRFNFLKSILSFPIPKQLQIHFISFFLILYFYILNIFCLKNVFWYFFILLYGKIVSAIFKVKMDNISVNVVWYCKYVIITLHLDYYFQCF